MAANPHNDEPARRKTPEEFSRFEQLTRKLLRVSKSDLDKQVKRSKRGRSPRPT